MFPATDILAFDRNIRLKFYGLNESDFGLSGMRTNTFGNLL